MLALRRIFRIFNRILMVLFALLIVLWLFIWAFSPVLVRYFANQQLAVFDMRLSDESHVRFNPLALHANLENVTLLNKSDQSLASLQSLEIDVGFWALLNKEIRLDLGALRGLEFDMAMGDSLTQIAGFDLPVASSEVPEESVSEQDDAAFNFILGADHLQVDAIHLDIIHHSEHHIVEIKSLELTELLASPEHFSFALDLHAALNQSEIKLDSKVEGNLANISADISLGLEDFDVSKLAYQLGFPVAGRFSSELNFNVEHSALQTALVLQDGLLSVRDFSVSEAGYQAGLGHGALSIDSLSLVMAGEEVSLDLSANELSMSNLGVSIQDGSTLLNLGGMSVKSIHAQQTHGQSPQAKLASIDFSELILLPSKDEDGASVLELDAIRIGQTLYQNDSLSIDELALGAGRSFIALSEEGKLLGLPELPESQSQSDAQENNAEQAVDEQVESAVSYALSKLYFDEPFVLTVKDQSVSPEFNQQYTVSSLEVSNISSVNSQIPLEFKLAVEDRDYMKFALSGNATPFADKLNMKAEGKMQEFSLPKVSPYTQKYLGFVARQGNLEMDMTPRVENDQLGGNLKLHLKGTKFSASDTVDAYSLLDQSAVPLNVALDLLKDGNGNIELKIPLSGDVHDPAFGAQYLLGLVAKKAAMRQAKNYLMTTFVPYAKVISVAMVAGDYALKVRVEDLHYELGAVVAPEGQQEFIDQFAALVKEKEGLVLHICPVAVRSDIPGIDAKAELSVDQRNTLLSLASERAAVFKRMLVEQYEVPSNQIPVCSSELDLRADAKPRLEFKSQ